MTVINTKLFDKRMNVLKKFNKCSKETNAKEVYENRIYVNGTKFYSTNGHVMCFVEMVDCIKNDYADWFYFPSDKYVKKSVEVKNKKVYVDSTCVYSLTDTILNCEKVIPSQLESAKINYDLSIYNFKSPLKACSKKAHCTFYSDSVKFDYGSECGLICEIGDCVIDDFFENSSSSEFETISFPMEQCFNIFKISPKITIYQYDNSIKSPRVILANEYKFAIMAMMVD